MGRSRQAEHQALIDWLLQQVQAHQVDAVLIAGDVFDTGAPASYARELYNQLIARLHQAGVGLLILGGNHDSVSVLDESRDLLRHLGTQVIASTGAPQQHAITLPLRGPDARRSDPDGASQPGCIVCALPFIRARDVQQSQAGQSAQDKQLALQTAIQSTYQQVYEAALDLQQKLQATLGRKLPIIATGHLTTVGASSNESVREIYVGSLEAFPTNAFPPADYIALGFDEVRQTKQVLLVDLNENGLQGVTSLPVPVSQAMAALRCTLADLPNELKKIAADADPKRATWLDITIEEDDYLADLPARVQALVEELPVQVLRIKRQRGNSAPQLQSAAMESLDELTPQDVFARRLALETLEPPLQQALTERYRSVVESLSHPENHPGSAA